MPRDQPDHDDHGDDDNGPSNWVNFGAFLVLALIVLAGVWLMDEMLRISKLEDCAMAGRRNCGTSIQVPLNR
jgi:uncharacterized membrane protein YcjF (UPF0283 family)